MENGTKHRILYLYQHLLQHTDAEHPLSTAELIKILKEQYAIKVSRNTISDDLTILHDCGLHIEHYESTQNKYYYDGHAYDLAELKLLVDAISSSRFITQRKSDELIKKLLTLTSAANAAKLRRHVYVSGRAKSENEQGYYIVDAIHEAIDTRRKIRLIYTDYDVNKKRYMTNDGAPYTVSPYTLEWDGDYYYLRGFCDELDKYFHLGKNLNQRDTIAVRKMVGGFIKLLYPDGVYTKEQLEEILKLSLEMRRRVKEQLKKLGGKEFYDVNFSYIDNETFEEHYVSVPEQGGGKLIPEGICNPGQVYTVS